MLFLGEEGTSGEFDGLVVGIDDVWRAGEFDSGMVVAGGDGDFFG